MCLFRAYIIRINLYKKGDAKNASPLDYILDYFPEWQELLIGQSAQPQPQPQEDLPFSLFRTILAIMAVTIPISAAHIIIVAIFCDIHSNILLPPENYFPTLTVFVSLVDSLYGFIIIYSINASTARAKIRPITFMLPVNTEPI